MQNSQGHHLSAGDFITKGFEFLTTNFVHLIPLVLLASLPANVGHVLTYLKGDEGTNSTASSANLFGILSFLLAMLLSLVVQAYVFHMIKHNKRLPFIEAVEFGLSKAKILIPVLLLTSLYIFLGLLLFVIPGLIFAFWYSFSNIVKLDDESLSAKSAMSRSKDLFKKNRSLVAKVILFMIGITLPILIFSTLLLIPINLLVGSIATELITGLIAIAIEAAFVYLYMSIAATTPKVHKA